MKPAGLWDVPSVPAQCRSCTARILDSYPSEGEEQWWAAAVGLPSPPLLPSSLLVSLPEHRLCPGHTLVSAPCLRLCASRQLRRGSLASVLPFMPPQSQILAPNPPVLW